MHFILLYGAIKFIFWPSSRKKIVLPSVCSGIKLHIRKNLFSIVARYTILLYKTKWNKVQNMMQKKFFFPFIFFLITLDKQEMILICMFFDNIWTWLIYGSKKRLRLPIFLLALFLEKLPMRCHINLLMHGLLKN